MTTILNKRVLQTYSSLEETIIRLNKEVILCEFKILRSNGLKIYNNQKIIGDQIVDIFKNKEIINTMVISRTQSGKTGSMCATIKKYLKDPTNLIPIENIYIISGISSCEWKEQTKERLPKSLEKNVYQRNELLSLFKNEIKNKTNVLIIIDEVHIASKKDQTIHKCFEIANMLDIQTLYRNDIKIIEYTATPDGLYYDLMKWKNASYKLIGNVGRGYIGAYDLLLSNRVRQYRDLYGYNEKTNETCKKTLEHIQELKNVINSYNSKRYHIIRTKVGHEADITIKNFKEIFNNNKLYKFINYDGESDESDINDILKNNPLKHTIIFIKEMLRCAKTINKTYIGILYERYTLKPDDSTIIQGLIGRNTGYDDNGSSIIYTNIESIEKYEKLWDSDFEDDTIKWNSKTTKYKDGKLNGKKTFNDILQLK
jgi:hypothetical protein